MQKFNFLNRGTVRDPQKTEGFQHLIDLAKEICGDKAEERLKFFGANLLTEGSFDECTEGAYSVMHVASNVSLSVKDPENELIKPAVNVKNENQKKKKKFSKKIKKINIKGTLNVLKSCQKNKIKVLVLTSSVAAIGNFFFFFFFF